MGHDFQVVRFRYGSEDNFINIDINFFFDRHEIPPLLVEPRLKPFRV
jgi:hypothetical protein